MLDNIPLILTIDLEEFDIPLEYGQSIDLTEQMAVSYEGLKRILPVLEKHHVAATFFTTAHWAEHYPKMVYTLAQDHEIASHAYFHSSFDEKDYALSKKTLENKRVRRFHVLGQGNTPFLDNALPNEPL